MILLDTHALVWWVNGGNELSLPARRAIDGERKARGAILVSAISAWEIAMLVDRGRLLLDRDVEDWLEQLDLIEGLELVSVDRDIAVKSVRLPGDFHRDPADRFIVATARRFASPVVTADEKIIAYPHVKTVW